MKKRESDRIKELLGAGIKDGVEIRTQKVELRVNRKEDGALPKIEGYASVFNKDSEDMGFIERVAPGAFKKALKISDARALFNHDPNYILGRQSSGTLKLKEDKTGLFMSVNPPDTQIIRDLVLTPIERGDMTEQSFGFSIAADEWKDLDTDHPTRTITEVKNVFDVSPVTFAAYNDTSVALRSLALAKENFVEPEPEPDEFTITVRAPGLDPEEIDFGFSDKEEAQKFIDDTRLLLSPMTADGDDPEPEPMLKKDSGDKEPYDLLTRISKKVEELKS
jgi:HK97 family phage prohead protease